MIDQALQFAKENQAAHIEQLCDWLRIPSISTDPTYAEDCKKAADWLADDMRRIGLENVDVKDTARHPLVFGDWLHAGEDAPTVLIYGHYDVQPDVPVDEWNTPPFEPTEKDGALFARGAADDKGAFLLLLKAVEAWLQTSGKLPVNVKFLVEGEEESGGENLEAYIKDPTNHAALAADVALLSDTAAVSEQLPTITSGIRGLLYCELHIQSAASDLHSGFAGGAVMNPIHALSWTLGKLQDQATGKVLIPGFYDDVVFTDQDREEIAKIPVDEAEWLSTIGVSNSWGEEGYSLAERNSARPALDANGIWGGYSGEGAKTVLPAKAGAKFSMRLVPNQEPEKIIAATKAYLEEIIPKEVTWDLKLDHGSAAAVIDSSSVAMQAASSAMEQTFGKAPVFDRSGGTIPIVSILKQELGMDTLMPAFGLPDDAIHAPNERFKLSQFHKGVEAMIRFFGEYRAAS